MVAITRSRAQEIRNHLVKEFLETTGSTKVASALEHAGVLELEDMLTLPNEIIDKLTVASNADAPTLYQTMRYSS